MARILILALSLVLAGAWRPAGAAEPRTFKVSAFAGGFNLPVWLAQDLGYFRDEGLQIDLVPAANSPQQMKGVIDGEYDIAHAAFDNVLAYKTGRGAVPTVRSPDIVGVMSLDHGFLSLVVTPDVGSVAELRGRTLAVDSLGSGFAFVMLEALRQAGVPRGEVQFATVGGSPQRLQALARRDAAGTMLVTPFDILAEAQGLRVLVRAQDLLPNYQGVAITVHRAFAEANREALQGYLRAMSLALGKMRDPAERPRVVRLMQENTPGASPDAAERSVDALLAAPFGFAQNGGAFEPAAVRAVLDLRARHAGQYDLGGAERFVDSGFLPSALTRR